MADQTRWVPVSERNPPTDGDHMTLHADSGGWAFGRDYWCGESESWADGEETSPSYWLDGVPALPAAPPVPEPLKCVECGRDTEHQPRCWTCNEKSLRAAGEAQQAAALAVRVDALLLEWSRETGTAIEYLSREKAAAELKRREDARGMTAQDRVGPRIGLGAWAHKRHADGVVTLKPSAEIVHFEVGEMIPLGRGRIAVDPHPDGTMTVTYVNRADGTIRVK